MSDSHYRTGQPTVGTQFLPGPKEIDWGKVEADFEREIATRMIQFRDELWRLWRDKVNDKFTAETRNRYLAELQATIVHDGVEFQIEGWLPTALEYGSERFDMKPGLLAGRSHRVIRLRNGNFRTVSSTSKPESWWHPGIQAADIREQVKAEAPAISERVFSGIFDRLEI